MLVFLPFWSILLLACLLHFSSAIESTCPTSPFCDDYPECSRECLGAKVNSNIAFFHSYGVDMTQICSTGVSLGDHYSAIFICIDNNCTRSTDRQAAWNQLVDDCGRKGFTVDSRLTPVGYSVHMPVKIIESSSTSGLTGLPNPTVSTISSFHTLPNSSSASSGRPGTSITAATTGTIETSTTATSATTAPSNDHGGLSTSTIAVITLGSFILTGIGVLVTLCSGWVKFYQFLWFVTCGRMGHRHKRRGTQENEPSRHLHT